MLAAAVCARVPGARAMATAAPQIPATSFKPMPYNGPSAETVQALRKQHMSPAWFHYYKTPVMIVEGKMQYVWDDKGRRYGDWFGGIVTVGVGHCHPHVQKALMDASSRIWHTTQLYNQPWVAEYCQKLASKLPSHLSVVYLTNSGSEANDMAIHMARVATGVQDIVALRNCYHGASQGASGVTALSSWKFPFTNQPGVHHAMNPDPYRGQFAGDPDCASKYANDVQQVIDFCTTGKLAAYIAEPIQGVGGAMQLPKGYLPKVYEIVKAAGGLCISDEVQTGFGRLGSHFWGFEEAGVRPDIVTMGKSIGNGFPLGAVVTTPEIAAHMGKKLTFNTYGGNPLSSAVGKAVLEVIEKEQLQANCAARGAQLKAGFVELAKKHSIIGHIRGEGLMLGVELVKDRATKVPATAETGQVLELAKDMGVLVGKGGFKGNVLRIKPPMCVTEADAKFFLEVMDAALSKL